MIFCLNNPHSPSRGSGSDDPRPFLVFYNRFHAPLVELAPRLVVSDFPRTVGDFGSVIAEVNRRYRRQFAPFAGSEEQKAATLRRDVQAKRQQLDRMFQTSMNTIRTTLLQVIDEIAAERKATLVLSKSQVLLAAKEYDITEESMKRLNAKLPTLAVELPK